MNGNKNSSHNQGSQAPVSAGKLQKGFALKKAAVPPPSRGFQISLLALLAAGSFLTSAFNQYCYDDVYIVFHNPNVRSLAHWPLLFVQDYWAPMLRMGLYRPLAILSFALEWRLRPNAAWLYHATNLGLNALVTVLLYVLARRLLRPAPAFFAAAWFGCTAQHLGVVAGLVGRCDLLAAAGALLALLAAIEAIECHGRGAEWRGLGWSAAAFLLALMALLCKESVIALAGLPVCMIWLRALPQRGTVAAPAAAGPAVKTPHWSRGVLQSDDAMDESQTKPGEIVGRGTGFLLGLIQRQSNKFAQRFFTEAGHWNGEAKKVAPPLRQPAVWALGAATVVYLMMRVQVVGWMARRIQYICNPLLYAGWFARLETALWSGLIGCLDLLWPFHMPQDYCYNQMAVITRPGSPRGLAVWGMLAGIAGLIWLMRKKPAARLGWLWLGLTYLPVSNLLFLIGAIHANRLFYFPSLGLALVLGAGAEMLSDSLRGWRWPRAAAAAAAACGVLLLSAYAWTDLRQGPQWSDNLSFFAYMARSSPRSAVAHFDYGGVLQQWGHEKRAAAQFRAAILIHPVYRAAWLALAQCRLLQHNHAWALLDLRHAFWLHPLPGVFNQLAPLELQAGHNGSLVREGRALRGFQLAPAQKAWVLEAENRSRNSPVKRRKTHRR